MKSSDISGLVSGRARATRVSRSARWASVAAWALLAATAQAQDTEASAVLEAAPSQDVSDAKAAEIAAAENAALEARLEQAGATIREVHVTVDNVFNPDNPKENKPLYRWANKVHIRTHDPVIESALLFEVGDRYERRVLDESARALRARGYLADVKIGPESYDPVANTNRKSTRLNSSHLGISYAVFCLKKKTNDNTRTKNT